MFATPALEEVAIVRDAPQSFINHHETENFMDVILNEPDKRPKKSTEEILLQSELISFIIEYDRINNLYGKYRNLFPVDFKTFYDAYREMSDVMNDILPEHCDAVTEVSVENECLYNYYEYNNQKIFFNLYFDEDGLSPVAQINFHVNKKFNSIEGSIKAVASYLKNALDNNTNV